MAVAHIVERLPDGRAPPLREWRHTECSLMVERARQLMLTHGWAMMEALEGARIDAHYGGIPDAVLEVAHQAIAPYHVGPLDLLSRLHWQRQMIAGDELNRGDELLVMVDVRDALMVEEPAS